METNQSNTNNSDLENLCTTCNGEEIIRHLGRIIPCPNCCPDEYKSTINKLKINQKEKENECN